MDLSKKKGDKMMRDDEKYVIGVLAIQGAVAEHMNCIRKLGSDAIEVSSPLLLLDSNLNVHIRLENRSI